MEPALSHYLRAVPNLVGGRCQSRHWAVLFFAVFTIPTAFGKPPTTRESWPRFLNSGFDGSAVLSPDATNTLASLNWAASPRCVWSINVGDGYGLGVVRDGAYFHFDADDGQERLSKINLSDGQQQWQQSSPLKYRDLYGYETGPRCSPTIDWRPNLYVRSCRRIDRTQYHRRRRTMESFDQCDLRCGPKFLWRRILAVGAWGNCHCDDWR